MVYMALFHWNRLTWSVPPLNKENICLSIKHYAWCDIEKPVCHVNWRSADDMAARHWLHVFSWYLHIQWIHSIAIYWLGATNRDANSSNKNIDDDDDDDNQQRSCSIANQTKKPVWLCKIYVNNMIIIFFLAWAMKFANILLTKLRTLCICFKQIQTRDIKDISTFLRYFVFNQVKLWNLYITTRFQRKRWNKEKKMRSLKYHMIILLLIHSVYESMIEDDGNNFQAQCFACRVGADFVTFSHVENEAMLLPFKAT